ncbi:MAG: hypothetical protein R6V44_12255 [Paracoccaceae bacterium]
MAAEFIRRMNRKVHGDDASAVTIVEQSAARPGGHRPVHEGGLGFGFKWDMGWTNDTLQHMSLCTEAIATAR